MSRASKAIAPLQALSPIFPKKFEITSPRNLLPEYEKGISFHTFSTSKLPTILEAAVPLKDINDGKNHRATFVFWLHSHTFIFETDGFG
jgi:hypothetical protein